MASKNLLPNMERRDNSLDFICGILIIYMIELHIAQCTDIHFPISMAFFYFMPWFFFKAGFHKVSENKKIISKSFTRLMIPYFIFLILGQFIYFTIIHPQPLLVSLKDTFDQLLDTGSTSGEGPLWFLLSLFLVRVLFNVLIRTTMSSLFIALSSMGIVMSLYYLKIDKPLYLLTLFSGMCFYSFGYLLKNTQYLTKSLTIASICLFIITIYCPTSVDMRINYLAKGLYFMWFPYCISGIIVINNLIKATDNTLMKLTGLYRIIVNIGKESMGYYVLHWIVLLVANHILALTLPSTKGARAFWIITIISALILPILTKLFITLFPKSLGISVTAANLTKCTKLTSPKTLK